MNEFRLAMSILVRDEADVIADNVRFHQSFGVDCFVVTDNGSVDGTREILAELSREVELIVIDEPSHTIDQDIWVTRMAGVARDRLGAAWIIHNDADEFWLPDSGSLKSEIDGKHTVIVCPRVNLLPSHAGVGRDAYRFYHNVVKIQAPAPPLQPQPSADAELPYPVTLSTVGPKVMCSLEGLRSVAMGNHDVVHENACQRQADSVLIHHYPIRTFEQFERKVRNYGESLRANRRHAPTTSWHLRRWHAMLERGTLHDEYERLAVTETQEQELVDRGIARIDYTLWEWLSPQTLPGIRPADVDAGTTESGDTSSASDGVRSLTGRPTFFVPEVCSEHERGLLEQVLSGREYPGLPPIPAYRMGAVVDAGANVGSFASFVRSVHPGAPIVCLEPSPRNLPFLRANVGALHGVEVVPFGLSGRSCRRVLRLGGDGCGLTDSVHANRLSGPDAVPVSFLGAADFLNERRFERISILKLDTEGCELEILRSIEEHLERIDAIYLEFHSDDDRREIDALLARRYLLFHSTVSVPHRGTCCYLERTLAARAGLDERAIRTTDGAALASPDPIETLPRG